MRTVCVWLAILLSIAGCSITTVRDGYSLEPEEAIEAARAKADAGHWSDAMLLLDVTVSRFPDHEELNKAQQKLQTDFQHHRERWEDRLLALRAQELVNRIPVLEQMYEAEPMRLQVQWGLKEDRAELAALRPKLLACGERQLKRRLRLASTCVRLADWASSDASSRRLADQIALRNAEIEHTQRDFEQRLNEVAREVEQQQEEAKRKNREQARLSQIEKKLSRAERRLSQSAYAEAALLIDQALALDPKHQRARSLQRRLDRTLARQRRLLDDLASRYYTEGDIDAAIKVWETLMQLSPGQKDVAERLERARRVRDKLSTVRAAGERAPK